MADPKGFLTLRRATPERQAVDERVHHWGEFYRPAPESAVQTQAARCMDCGVPFCQGDTGCPVRNIIPEWNDLVHRGEWREALESLHATNNFPELTGRLCPAPCESACVLGLVNEPVAIRHIEQTIADRGFAEGWVVARPPRRISGFSVAVVGSGPAGPAATGHGRGVGLDVADVLHRDAQSVVDDLGERGPRHARHVLAYSVEDDDRVVHRVPEDRQERGDGAARQLAADE